MTTEIKAIQQKVTPYQLIPTSFEQLHKLATMISDSDLAPKDYKDKPGNCLVAMQMGAEVGLMPMQALQNIAVINGRPSIWGDAALALVMSSPVYGLVEEYEDGDFSLGTLTAYCRAKRKDGTEKICSFSIKDATLAGLWKKQGPWTQYPRRMLQMRARSFALRDVFPDVLKGLAITEEVIDIPKEIFPIPRHEENKKGSAALLEKFNAASKEESIEATKTENNAIDIVGISIDEIIGMIEMAKTQEDLDLAVDLVRSLPEEDKERIRPIYSTKKTQLEAKK